MSNPPQLPNSSFFHGAQNFSISNAQFTEIHVHPAPVQSPLPPLPPLKQSSTFFVGRDEYLQRMKDHFSPHDEGKRKSFLLYGLGGIGKTQICLRFLEQNPGLFSDIHWLDAASEATIELGLMQIAQAKNAPKEVIHSPGFILQWISQMPRWLIIYDSADGDYSVVEKFLPPGEAGNILITSRNGELKRLVLGWVNVLAMEEDEGVTLFLKSAMLDGTSDDVRNVAKKMVVELSGIPLALDQAGAYIHKSGCGIDDYLKLYQKNKHKLMSKKEFKGASGYGRSAYGTWDISFQQIEQMTLKENEEAKAAQSAITLLKIFAFLNHENIPEELFKNAAENYMNDNVDTANSDFPMTLLNHQTLFIDEDGEWDKVQFLDGTQVLLSFSLISGVNHLYSMHLLVNSWSRSCMSQKEISNHYHRARALLSCSIIPDWNVDNHAFCRLLAPHIRSNLLHGQELKFQDKYYGHEYDRFSIVFGHIGSWDEREKVLNAALERAVLESDHPGTLTIMNELAFTYRNQGRWHEAEKLQVEVMTTWKVKLGLDHPDTLTAMNNLALIYSRQGRWDEAEKLQVEVINAWRVDEADELQVEAMKAQKVKLGSDYPAALTIMNNLALTYQNQGRWDEAEKLQMEVMKARKAKLGSDHPDTFAAMNNLASTYYDQGRWDEAEKLQVEVMKAQKVKLGADHPGTLTTINNLALTYRDQGRWDEAEKLQVEVMNAWKVKLGLDHPDTLTAMNNLGLTYCNLGRWGEAEKLQVGVMKARKVKQGLDHPSTLTAMNNLAFTYQIQRRWDEAEKLQMGVMKVQKVKLGANHPGTLTTMNNLASTYQNQGRWDVAEKLQVEVMNAWKVMLGLDHPGTLTAMDNLAMTYKYQGRWNEAEKLQVEVMNAQKVKLGSDHPGTLAAMNNLAITYTYQGRLNEAETLQVDVMHARKAKLGLEHPDTLQVMANLALTYKSQERLDEAESLLSHAVQTMQQVMGSEHHVTHHYKQQLDKLLNAKQKNRLQRYKN
ncbi:hypothetical protein F5887DRAFT_1287803 [Amanita rubescens]|nr:hypothetical protein F5887DRAFT_1287803 [Amanita rubescens]